MRGEPDAVALSRDLYGRRAERIDVAARAGDQHRDVKGRYARQQLKELCEKFSADLTIAEVTDVLVPKGSFSFEFAVDGLRCGVGSARSKKEAKEQAAALALRALAREPPRDL